MSRRVPLFKLSQRPWVVFGVLVSQTTWTLAMLPFLLGVSLEHLPSISWIPLTRCHGLRDRMAVQGPLLLGTWEPVIVCIFPSC